MNTPPSVPPAADESPSITPVAVPPPNPLGGFALDFFIAIGVLIGTVFAGMVAWGFFKAVQLGMQNPDVAANPDALTKAMGEPGPAVLMIVSSLGMALAALATYYWRRRATTEERIRSKAAASKARTWVEAIGLGVALYLASTTLMWGLDKAGHQPNPTNMAMLEAVLAYSPALLVLVAVVMAPIFEELLFRRVLFGRLWAAGKPVAGMVASSVLFAFAHEVPGTTDSPWAMTLILLLFYAAMGACMAWIYRRTGTLWAPIATHATNNLLGVGMMIAGYAG